MKKNVDQDENSFLPDYSKTGDLALTHQDTLRRFAGFLGMILPILVYLFLQIDSQFGTVLPSISHYYYTRACSVFIVCVSTLAVFLLIYKGEERIDFYVSFTAGIAAFCVLLFPTNNLEGLADGAYNDVTVTHLKECDFRHQFHYFSAAVFLSCLTYMAFFLFTKSNTPPSKRPKTKILRNRIYRVCGVIMAVSMLIIFLGYLCVIPPRFYDDNCLTFWMEVVCVEAFGLAWIVKGKSLLPDRNER